MVGVHDIFISYMRFGGTVLTPRIFMCMHCLDLFDRLRELRGSKTMVFSSHRFGNLTRHADLIL